MMPNLKQDARTVVEALEDWVHQYAPDMCEPLDVEEAMQRISKDGTLYYIAQALSAARRLAAHVDGSPFVAVGIVRGNGELTVYEREIPDGEHIVYITRKGLLAAHVEGSGEAVAEVKPNGLVHWYKEPFPKDGTLLYAHAAPSAWISVKERLPERDVEVWASGWNYAAPGTERWSVLLKLGDVHQYGDWWRETDLGPMENYTPTHWQPLPAPPAASERREPT